MDAIDKFKSSVHPLKTHLLRLPKIILIFGSGPIGIEEEHKNSSLRNVFLNWSHASKLEIRDQFQLPEYFPEWNKFEGYQNLVDFERDAGALSSVVLLFSEGAGALAELGAFCMDSVLSERLLVVISRKHHQSDSFVVHGPLLKLTGDHDASSVCLIEADTPSDFYDEAPAVAQALIEKLAESPKKELIRSERQRDRLLLIVDLVELFGATTETELLGLLSFFNVELDRASFRRMVGLLVLFGLVTTTQVYRQSFLVAPSKDRDFYLDYSSAGESNKFDRSRFKISAFSELMSDSRRRQAYEVIHGRVKHEAD